jgi:hypothetical protein
MAHYALLDDNNIVTQVITGRNEDEMLNGITNWEEYYSEVTGQKCLKTSYNTYAGQHRDGGTPFRKNCAAIGYSYDEGRDAFIPPKPFDSWTLNEETCLWESPVPRPPYVSPYTVRHEWDDKNQNWRTIEVHN